MSLEPTEQEACFPIHVDSSKFNKEAVLPYGLKVGHIEQAMVDFVEFLDMINGLVFGEGIPRLERLLMPPTSAACLGNLLKRPFPGTALPS